MTYTHYPQTFITWRYYNLKAKPSYWHRMLTKPDYLKPVHMEFLNTWKKPILHGINECIKDFEIESSGI